MSDNSKLSEKKEKRKKQNRLRIIKICILLMMTVNMVFLFFTAVKVTKLQKLREEKENDLSSSESDLSVDSSLASEDVTAPSIDEETESFEVVIGSESMEDELPEGSFLSLEEIEKLLSAGEKKNDDSGLHVWVGDSRTVGLSAYTKHEERDVFIAEIGMAYDWFERVAVPQLELYLGEGIVSKVYINMGVNDCAVAYRSDSEFPSEKYVRKINDLVLMYPGVDFYFYSVGPSGAGFYGNVDLYALNQYVDGFNFTLENFCGATYIPCAEYLKEDGYTTTDGIHYDKATCQKIYDFVVKSSTR